jgi:hypothetical protein
MAGKAQSANQGRRQVATAATAGLHKRASFTIMGRSQVRGPSNPLGRNNHNTSDGTGSVMVQFNTVYFPRISSGHLPSTLLDG